MIRTLVRKELLHHGAAFCLLGALALGSYGLIMASFLARGEAGSVFESVRLFILMMTVIASLVLGHRLVVLEYQAKTQLFLQSLPCSQWRMIAVKYLLGWSFLLGLLALVFAGAIWSAGRTEVLERQFLVIAGMRALAYTWLAYNFFFMMGFLGRYRIPLYIAMFLFLMALDSLTALEIQRLGPLVLMDERFAYEGDEFPAAALRSTLGLAAAFLAITFALGLTREGSVAALLSEKMSHREKVFIATILMGFVFAITVFDERTEKEPFDLHQAAAVERNGILVKVSHGSGAGHGIAHDLAQAIAGELESVKEYLELPSLPPVFVTHRRDLDPDRYERGILKEAEGVLARANYGGTDWNQKEFLAWLLREVLINWSQGRARLEPKMWVLDGFSIFWMHRDRDSNLEGEIKQYLLRALYGTREGFTTVDLEQWLRFRERTGDDIAAAVAWSGLEVLREKQGEERARQFLQSVLGMEVPRDFRAVLHERQAPLEKLLEREAQLGFDEFFGMWRGELDARRDAYARELEQLPILEGTVEFVPLSADTRKVVYRLQIHPEPEGEIRYSFRHGLLPVLDREVDLQQVKRERHTYVPGEEQELPGSFSRGTRFYSTFALDVPELGCRVISGWNRQEIR